MILEALRYRVRGYIPFTNWWLLERKLDRSAETILDLGCGRGKQMRFLNRKKQFYTVGVDLFDPYLDECRKDSNYKCVVKCDIRHLPYGDNSFDVVMCLDVLEHLGKDDGDRLVCDMVRIARKQVLIQTPVGSYDWRGIHGNPLNRHIHVWSVAELQAYKFSGMYGRSLRGMCGDSGWSRRIPGSLRWLWDTVVAILVGCVVYFRPEWAGSVLCVAVPHAKEVDDHA